MRQPRPALNSAIDKEQYNMHTFEVDRELLIALTIATVFVVALVGVCYLLVGDLQKTDRPINIELKTIGGEVFTGTTTIGELAHTKQFDM
jgi:Ca2+/Na+ antiporter